MVTRPHVEKYQREGYCIVDKLLEPREVDRVCEYLDPWIEEQARHMRPEHLDKPHVWDKHFLDFCSQPKLLDAVEPFIGPNIVLFSSHIISKAKGDGLAVPWHQDGNYWPLEPMNVITLWLAIDDSTVENGCMRVIPGTHTLGPIEHEAAENPETKVLHEQIPAGYVDQSKAVDCVIPRGGCSFHAPYIIHGSTPNTSPRRRCGYTMRFMPAETKMLRTGKFAKWFAQHPLFLLRGRDASRTNTYANVV
jgi:ectoine hydroxylase-related dioxygenase (phytanoyl-CoA dioxygenase family)